jgi:RNA polymerase sigma factor (sigma-70 family)
VVHGSQEEPVHHETPDVREREVRSREDAKLAAGYQRGEEWAFAEVERWIRSELRRRYPRLQDEFDDLCQTVHEKLLTSLRAGRFHGDSSLRTYATSIALHTAIDRLRELYRERALTELAERPGSVVLPNPYGRAEQLDEARLLHQVLQSLPSSCRELWHLVFVERLSYEEVGRRLRVPEGTVKSRMWHCRQKAMDLFRRLRDRLGSH